jgi:type IV secretion system protein VirB5
VVEVDRLGRAVAFGPAEPLQETDRRVVIAQLTQFVRNVRSVVPSVEAERALINEAYTFVDQRGATFLNTYFADADHDPRVLGAHMTRLVEVTSVLAVPTPESSHAGSQANPHVPTAWKITWTEQDIPTAAGGSIISAAWEGFFTIRVIPPTRADVIQENPLGLYVTAITWTQLATRRSLSTLNGEIPE